MGRTRGTSLTVTNAEGKCVSKPAAVKEEWMGYFQSLLNPKMAPTVDHEALDECGHTQSRDLDSEELNDDITIEEVRTAIYVNSDNKFPGIDGMNLHL